MKKIFAAVFGLADRLHKKNCSRHAYQLSPVFGAIFFSLKCGADFWERSPPATHADKLLSDKPVAS
ncbi:MAG: hypothetical protein IJ774_05755 [Selenomonadaceae bacterium]|nr:hypothetical protein [Selenomonadaceae bacterium]